MKLFHEYVIGCWTRPGTTPVYTKGTKKSKWPWSISIEVPKRPIIRPTLSTDTVHTTTFPMGEAKEVF